MAEWLETTWFGGCNNAESDVRGRVLAPNRASAAFSHRARVRRTANGGVEGEWFNKPHQRRPGEWVPFTRNSRIPAALLKQAEAELAGAAR